MWSRVCDICSSPASGGHWIPKFKLRLARIQTKLQWQVCTIRLLRPGENNHSFLVFLMLVAFAKTAKLDFLNGCLLLTLAQLQGS